ncbi:MAG: GNAT family N-acetyltransferase [Clostridia bacterium]|nr:GNAT family N-acetyltransferase [Clostridia bacterium]
MITIRIIGEDRKEDINIKNEPFKLFGRMLPSYTGEEWRYEIERSPTEKITEMRFPDENYPYDELAESCIFIGAYDGDACIGLAILRHEWHKFLYLYDLKVNADYRGRHIGRRLIDKAKAIALENGYRGLWTQGQDNNLAACLFYIANGFAIGGLDTHIYAGTSQEGKKDILFYYDAMQGESA